MHAFSLAALLFSAASSVALASVRGLLRPVAGTEALQSSDHHDLHPDMFGRALGLAESPHPVPADVTPQSFLHPGVRILNYLHGRGEALDITTPSPVKATYIDYRDINWSRPGDSVKAIVDGGYNVVILAFYVAAGPVDMAVAWRDLAADEKQSIISYAHSRGAIVLVSAGGSTDVPYMTVSPAVYGRNVAQFTVDQGLDGVDFDMEEFSPGMTYGPVNAVQWLIDTTAAARAVLGPGRIITHAPQAPYFGPVGVATAVQDSWPGTAGGYTSVWQRSAGAIDWMNVQWYNQGGQCYTSYASLFRTSSSDCPYFPGTSVAEIASYGIPQDALVIGKYLIKDADASNGWVAAADLGAWAARAKQEIGWSAGYMQWCWEARLSPPWISAIYPPTTPTAPTAPTATPSPSPAPASPSPQPSSPPAAPSPSAAASRSVAPSPISSASTSPSPSAAPSKAASVTPRPSVGTPAPSSTVIPSTSAAPSRSPTPTPTTTAAVTTTASPLPISMDGRCGAGVAVCRAGYCCSSLGWCGAGPAWCSSLSGCQAAYGVCN